MNKTLKSNKKANIKEAKEEMDIQIKQKRLFSWENREEK